MTAARVVLVGVLFAVLGAAPPVWADDGSSGAQTISVTIPGPPRGHSPGGGGGPGGSGLAFTGTDFASLLAAAALLLAVGVLLVLAGREPS